MSKKSIKILAEHLNAATELGDRVTVNDLLRRGATANFRIARNGMTAFHVAAALNKPKILNLLLKYRPMDSKIPDDEENLPSHYLHDDIEERLRNDLIAAQCSPRTDLN